jgi:hypothetical protein
MKFIISCSLLFIFITTFLCYESIAQPNFVPSCHIHKGNYTTNSTYQHNLNTVLTTLTSNTEITYGFYNFTYGIDNNKVYAIGLCRGDVNPQNCRQCLNNSRYLLTQSCPNKKEAIGWTDGCMLRYSNRSIFGLMETIPSDYEKYKFYELTVQPRQPPPPAPPPLSSPSTNHTSFQGMYACNLSIFIIIFFFE